MQQRLGQPRAWLNQVLPNVDEQTNALRAYALGPLPCSPLESDPPPPLAAPCSSDETPSGTRSGGAIRPADPAPSRLGRPAPHSSLVLMPVAAATRWPLPGFLVSRKAHSCCRL